MDVQVVEAGIEGRSGVEVGGGGTVLKDIQIPGGGGEGALPGHW